MDFDTLTWTSLIIAVVWIAAMEAWLRLGPKGRRTQTAAAGISLFGFLQMSDFITTRVGDQLPVVVFLIGITIWRLRQVTTTPPGKKA